MRLMADDRGTPNIQRVKTLTMLISISEQQ
jgi:hypothetical protein